MQFEVFIQDFTGVYREQPFMMFLKNETRSHWMDCTQISGTDCYCDDDAQAEIRKMIDNAGATFPGIHFFDNGNYHYMSKIWTDSVQDKFSLVVFDHHPDMQPPRFEGILSCGGWIKEVLDHNKNVQDIIIIGVADHLIEEIKNDPTANFEIYQEQVTFIPESALEASMPGDNIPQLQQALRNLHSSNVYISIDKDALNKGEAATNWDQGSLTLEQLKESLRELASRYKILGIDICGERAADADFSEGSSADEKNSKLNENLYKIICDL